MLPVLNHRALLREFAHVLKQAGQTETTSSSPYLKVINAEVTKRGMGRAATEALLIHLASVAAGALRTSDVIDSLGGGRPGHRACACERGRRGGQGG